MGHWYLETGPESDVVISSRVRLARNIGKYPFPHRASGEQQLGVLKEAQASLMSHKSALSKELLFMDMSNMPAIEKQGLVEKHLISPDFAGSRRVTGLAISKDESISIMINEEDHLRIQCMFSGMQMDKAWQLCSKIDTLLSEDIEFAYNTDTGYLTCCPTNVGTGIRASVMLHLPALTMTGYINGILESCSKLGVAVRGIYGENSDATGNMFQISNQVTLGLSEEELISNIIGIAEQISDQERNIRRELLRQGSVRFEDRVWRSYGLLRSARVITADESMKLLSDLKLGVDMKLIEEVPAEVINELLVFTQPANLQRMMGRSMQSDERDYARATYIRNKLRNNKDVNTTSKE